MRAIEGGREGEVEDVFWQSLAAQVHSGGSGSRGSGGGSGGAASGFVITDDVVWRRAEPHGVKHER